MADAARRSNVIIPANGETLQPQGTICGVLLTSANDTVELTISNAQGILAKYKLPHHNSSQDFSVEIRFDSELTFSLAGTGAEAYIYLEV